jgi:prepilin-type N-terminal cleavage/methylation domain-containing protein
MKPHLLLSRQTAHARRHIGAAAQRQLHAFSLIEIIAALAVVAILAAATLPVLIRQIDYAAQGIEATNLVTMASGFAQASSAQRYIPGFKNWDVFTATNIGWQLSAVQKNSRNNTRVFLIDQNLSIGATTAWTLPFQQDSNGAAPVVSPRFMIVSSLSAPLPPGLTTGVPASSDFNALWNTPNDTIPVGTSWAFNNWNGQGADLKIQRVNLATSFSHVVLTSLDPQPSSYSIDNSATISLNSGTKFDAYFLKGTVLNLYYSSASGQALQAAQVLEQDSSWFFCNGLWRNAPCPADLSLTGFESTVQNFFNVNLTVYNDMTNYMGLYLQYANGNFLSVSARLSLQNMTGKLNDGISDITTILKGK